MSACLVCGSDRIGVVFEATFKGGLEEAHRHFLTEREKSVHGKIVECAECGFRFTSPQFTPAEYGKIYSATPPLTEDDGSGSRFESLASRVRKTAPAGRFLDFGCGSGGFLRALNDRDGVGLEVGDAGEWRGRVYRGSLDMAMRTEEAFAPGSFDFIVTWDVLEHLPEIERDVANLRSLLREDGLLFFTVPNVASLNAKVMGRRWSSYLLEHLWYFAPKTMDRFLTERGFARIELHDIPYISNLGTAVRRLAQMVGVKATLPDAIGRVVLPVPIGILFGVYRKVG